ncbi:MAG: dTDP-4-dehydrorhamnose reductase [Holophagales bacterium]|nr:dTDP-4-dehydrorhamnose reductase [Holophagales bacterium]
MKTLISGASGQLATAVKRHWAKDSLIMPSEAELDLTDRESIRAAIQKYKPDVFLNCAAYTNVDAAESNEGLAKLVNGQAVGWIAQECNDVGALLVQVSTDYVFDGISTRPLKEDDPVGPCSAYGKSKLEGEVAAQKAYRHIIFRTSWLYDAWGKNFFNTMIRLANQGKPIKVVSDQRGSPTTCRALARQMRLAIESEWHGLFHATCTGETTWHGFAQAIFNMMGLAPECSPCSTQEYPTPAKRPAYSVLDNSKRMALGDDLMGPWEGALREVVKEKMAGRGQRAELVEVSGPPVACVDEAE